MRKRLNETESICETEKKPKGASAKLDVGPGIGIEHKFHVVAKIGKVESARYEEPVVDVSKDEDFSSVSSDSVASSSVALTSTLGFPSTSDAVVVIVAVVFLHLIVLNWSGEEIARLEVRPSDLVLTGMRQVEEQLGVPVARQMLVCNEDLLESGRAWSSYTCVRDWSTIQLTTMEQTFDAASDREALMVLFESCGGSKWRYNGNWGSAEALSEWDRVFVDQWGRVKGLHLDSNKLTGVMPPEIGNLSALVSFFAMGNDLTGEIPPEIGKLSLLTELGLDRNKLSGFVPVEFGDLTNLRYLNLRENLITGLISPELAGMTALSYLHLTEYIKIGGRHFVQRFLNEDDDDWDSASDRESLTTLYKGCGGARWRTNGNWGSAEPLSAWEGVGEVDKAGRVIRLDLPDVGMSGSIPPEIGYLTAIEVFSVPLNRLIGCIPSELSRFTTITVLDLSYNFLEGVIPPEIGYLTELNHLRLNNNLLTGPIPPELGLMRKLQCLDLNDNQLTGHIPKNLRHLPRLRNLSLHGNQLTGDNPSAEMKDRRAIQEFFSALP